MYLYKEQVEDNFATTIQITNKMNNQVFYVVETTEKGIKRTIGFSESLDVAYAFRLANAELEISSKFNLSMDSVGDTVLFEIEAKMPTQF